MSFKAPRILKVSLGPEVRKPDDILSFFTKNKADLTSPQLIAITRALGFANRNRHSGDKIDFTDVRLKDFVRTQSDAVAKYPPPLLGNLAHAVAAFGRSSPALIEHIFPLLREIQCRFTELAAALSPDEISEIVKLASIDKSRFDAFFEAKRFELLCKTIDKSITAYAYHNCRIVLDSTHHWPMTVESRELAGTVLERLVRVCDNATGDEGYETLHTVLSLPNYLRNLRGAVEIRTKLTKAVVKSWHNLSPKFKFFAAATFASRGQSVAGPGTYTRLFVEQELKSLAGEVILNNSMVDFSRAVALLNVQIPNLAELVDTYLQEKVDRDSYTNKFEIAWSLALLGENELSARVVKILPITLRNFGGIPPDTLANIYDLNVACPFLSDTTSYRVDNLEHERVFKAITSNLGRKVIGALPTVVGPDGQPLNFAQNKVIAGIRVCFYDEAQKLAIDIDSDFVPFALREQILKKHGVRLCVIPDDGSTGRFVDGIKRVVESSMRGESN